MPVETKSQQQTAMLAAKATRLRIDSVESTTAAGSGHPTSCASAAEIMSVLFFSVMRYDPKSPKNPDNDVFVLSKGHAAPILYSAWAEAGLFPREHLLTLRRIDSDLEGHPTPRLPYVDAATGSLGQGLSVALGIALNAKELEKTDQRVYVLMGDGESAEGSVWEAAQMASRHKLGNLCLTIDINRLGQSQPTMLEHHLDVYKARWEAFGWQAIEVDGHDIESLLEAYDRAEQTTDRPTAVLAQTYKGRGLGPKIEDQLNQHGKPLSEADAKEVVEHLRKQLPAEEQAWQPKLPAKRSKGTAQAQSSGRLPAAPYQIGGKEVATRKAFGDALAALGKVDPLVVVIDGDVKNSTYTEDFEKAFPDRFFEGFIAEQNMVGVAMGLAARGKVAYAATFACFLTRAADFIRMAAISRHHIKLAGTHVGVSIGEDGPSQMGLEDLALFCSQPDFAVLYPSDAASTWHATELIARYDGPGYLRIGRPNAPILYGPDEKFEIGKAKVLRESKDDVATVVGGGVTLIEALKAYDELKKQNISIRVVDLFSVQPIDQATLIECARATKGKVITVEDHYAHGGLGDAVLSALAQEDTRVTKLAVREIAHSGKPQELVEKFGISAKHIIEAVTRR